MYNAQPHENPRSLNTDNFSIRPTVEDELKCEISPFSMGNIKYNNTADTAHTFSLFQRKIKTENFGHICGDHSSAWVFPTAGND